MFGSFTNRRWMRAAATAYVMAVSSPPPSAPVVDDGPMMAARRMVPAQTTPIPRAAASAYELGISRPPSDPIIMPSLMGADLGIVASRYYSFHASISQPSNTVPRDQGIVQPPVFSGQPLAAHPAQHQFRYAPSAAYQYANNTPRDAGVVPQPPVFPSQSLAAHTSRLRYAAPDAYQYALGTPHDAVVPQAPIFPAWPDNPRQTPRAPRTAYELGGMGFLPPELLIGGGSVPQFTYVRSAALTVLPMGSRPPSDPLPAGIGHWSQPAPRLLYASPAAYQMVGGVTRDAPVQIAPPIAPLLPQPSGLLYAVRTAYIMGGGVTLEIVPDDLLAAIKDWFSLQPALVSSLPGGLWLSTARTRTFPYIVVREVSWQPVLMTLNASYEVRQIQFSVFATSAASARAVGKQFRDAINHINLSFADGVMTGGFQRLGNPGLMRDPDIGPLGQQIWHQFWTFAAQINPVVQ